MSDKKNPAEIMEVLKCKIIDNWKVIVAVLIVLIIFMNTSRGMVNSRIDRVVAAEVEILRSEFADFNALLSEVETGGNVAIDEDTLRAYIETIRETLGVFENKLRAIVEIEEGQLTLLEQSAAIQRANIEALRNLLGGAE